MKLQKILATLPPTWADVRTAPPPNAEVYGVAEDSRHVYAGYIFVARSGRDSDGHRYIAAAVEAGAVMIVSERGDVEVPAGVPHAVVKDGRAAFALLSAAFFDYPSRKLAVVGVTGTDGKTTTSILTHSILQRAGMRAGLITTISAQIGDSSFDTGFHTTTPGAFELQSYLAQMVEAGCKAAVVETTSHALDQGRVFYVHYDVAVVTNVTHEHLDWHGTWEGYLAAKARLFQFLGATLRKPGITKTAVLNADDRSYPFLRAMAADQQITYSLDPDAGTTLTATDVRVDRGGTQFTLYTPDGAAPVKLKLLGRYNVANALAAAAAGYSLGIGLEALVAGLEAVERVKGRMEFVPTGARFDVVVDFAHTPHALEQTLRLARELVPARGRVIAVFGSAGLRDVQKRALMGEVAGRLADLTVVTAEDPRTEDIGAILAEIETGLQQHKRRRDVDYWLIPDRTEAIAFAVGLAETGDMVITCGKAHEQSMCYGAEETPWDEFAAVRDGLARRWRAS
jgi:UDP-N-acetylmuramoyl-L-alanyl-D-glutamate--2,6-diaminopimelate ligase